MRQRSKGPLAAPARRRMLKQTTALGAVAIAAPYVLRSAHAQANADIAPGGAIAGRIVADIRTTVQPLRAILVIGGTVKEPQVRN